MKVGIHQPEHLPWIGFLNKAYMSDTFVILDNVQFEKNYFQNRNRIKTPNGPEWVTVPILTSGKSNQLINECKIDNNQKWQKKCWKKIYYAYKKAPFFDKYEDFFRKIYQKKFDKIVDLNYEIISFLFGAFGINTKIIKASDLKVRGEKTDLLLNICKKLEADTYISGISGRDYLDKTKFKKEEIDVVFQNLKHPKYPQINGEFIPKMSAIDLLFNLGGEKGGKLIKKDFLSK